GRNNAAWTVDIEGNILRRILRLQKQELGADQSADLVEDRAGQKYDPLLEQARVDIEGTFAAGGLFDHHGNEVVRVDLNRIAILHGGDLQVRESLIDRWNRSGRQPVVRLSRLGVRWFLRKFLNGD